MKLLPCFLFVPSFLLLCQCIFSIFLIIITTHTGNKIAVDCGQKVYNIDKGECRIKSFDFISSSYGSCVFQPYQFDNTSFYCYELYVSLGGDESSFESFLTRFESVDRDLRVRSINIKFAAPYTGKYAEMIDDFLTTRPWWTIKEEIFEDLHKCVSKTCS